MAELSLWQYSHPRLGERIRIYEITEEGEWLPIFDMSTNPDGFQNDYFAETRIDPAVRELIKAGETHRLINQFFLRGEYRGSIRPGEYSESVSASLAKLFQSNQLEKPSAHKELLKLLDHRLRDI